jgi:hypothetical protein
MMMKNGWPRKARWAVLVLAFALSASLLFQTAHADEAAIVSAPDNELNLRDAPNANAAIVTKLLNNTKAHITDTFANGWKKIVVDTMSETGNPPEGPLEGFVNGKYLITETVMLTTAFREGHADRQAWESWFGGLSGAYRDGAEFWASHRSEPRIPDCTFAGDVPFQAGCEEARKRLSVSDHRRLAEADYKAGWNIPATVDAPPSSRPNSASASPPAPSISPPPPAQAAPAEQSPSPSLSEQHGNAKPAADDGRGPVKVSCPRRNNDGSEFEEIIGFGFHRTTHAGMVVLMFSNCGMVETYTDGTKAPLVT